MFNVLFTIIRRKLTVFNEGYFGNLNKIIYKICINIYNIHFISAIVWRVSIKNSVTVILFFSIWYYYKKFYFLVYL